MKSRRENKRNLWVLVYTKPKQETKANENLQKQGFKTFLPLIQVSNKNNKFQPLVPIFPRYIFVQINLELGNWTSINSSHGVSGIVMFGDTFTSVPFKVIKLIKDKLNEGDVYKENISRHNYKEGDLLTIKKGRFVGIDAIFLSKKSKDRVRLLLKFLNTTVISELAQSDIGHKEVKVPFKF